MQVIDYISNGLFFVLFFTSCSYYRSAHALILVYDISCQPTFDCLPDWLREIQEYANSKVLKILVGNKTDRDDREIPTAIGEEFAKQQGMYFLETSAKEADNVERLFYEIAAELIEQARTKEVRARIDCNQTTWTLSDADLFVFSWNCRYHAVKLVEYRI